MIHRDFLLLDLVLIRHHYRMLVHHHLIYQAKVWKKFNKDAEKIFESFLYNLVEHLGMEVLISPQFAFTQDVNDAWTGLIWIITSHISFHYWTKEQYVQLDIYSCKIFNKDKTIKNLNDFWNASEAQWLRIHRKTNDRFEIEEY